MSQEQIRCAAAGETDQSRRAWRVTRRPGDPPQAKIAWSVTIMDVASGYNDAESYSEAVKEWARATLPEMQPLLPPP
jgi:hypothetical protein